MVLIGLAGAVLALLLAGCGGSSGGGATAAATPVPLADALDGMEPAAVWQHFYDLTQTPRPSHTEQAATDLVAEFGRGLGLETLVDDVGNVLVRKPASAGMEDRPGVVLQAHLDMVAQKAEGSSIDPAKDPLQPVVQDGWVSATGTTLGADDGIGVAVIMALLEDKTLVHGPLEALFTVNEEDGFTGVDNLSSSWLKGTTYINLDNGVEGEYLISSAGGVYLDITDTYDEVAPPADTTGFTVTVDGLAGGHSGLDIGKGGGSAHQVIARLFVEAPGKLDPRIGTLQGGTVNNAIPTTASAVVAVPKSQADAFRAYVADFGATVREELAATDPDTTVTVAAADLPARVMAAADQDALMGAVYAAPQGVYAWSDEVPGLVETSGNMGALAIADKHFAADVYVRSAVDSERDAEADRFTKVFEKAGCDVRPWGAYPGWPPRTDSPIRVLMLDTYQQTFGSEATATAVHAGLETSVTGSKYPKMDMISAGPTIKDEHTPDERLEVATVERIYDLVVATLTRVE
jgi:dipeptidase D